MKFKIAVFTLIAGLALIQPALADTSNNTKVTVDLQDLDQNTRDSVLAAIKVTPPPSPIQNVTPDEVKKWSAIGKGIGDAIAAAAKALNVGINEFIKTPAGLMVVWGLALYLWGGAIWGVVSASLVWIVLGFIIWRSFRKFHMPFVLKNADGSQGLVSYPWKSNDGKIFSAWVHVIAFFLLSVVCMLFIL